MLTHLKLQQVSGLPLANNDSVMCAPGIDYCGETSQAAAQHTGPRNEVALGPPRDGLAGEGGHGSHLDVDGIALNVERNRRDGRHLVLPDSTRLAADALAAEVRVIDLHVARQPMYSRAPGQTCRDLVMHQPRGRVPNANLALEVDCRQVGLGVADQVGGQEPSRQRQLVARGHRAGRHRPLVMAGV